MRGRREGGKRRYERNRCVDQVYTSRVVLEDYHDDGGVGDVVINRGDDDNGTMIEDTILSSVGDGPDYNLDRRYWMSHVGRQRDGSVGGTGAGDLEMVIVVTMVNIMIMIAVTKTRLPH